MRRQRLVPLSIYFAAVVAAAAFGLTACGLDDQPVDRNRPSGGDYSAAARQEASTAPKQQLTPVLAAPSVAELDAQVGRSIDPMVGDASKTATLENADRDPQLASRLVQAVTATNATVHITSIILVENGRLQAVADVTTNGVQVHEERIEFVAGKAHWQLGLDFTCAIIQKAGSDSAACQRD